MMRDVHLAGDSIADSALGNDFSYFAPPKTRSRSRDSSCSLSPNKRGPSVLGGSFFDVIDYDHVQLLPARREFEPELFCHGRSEVRARLIGIWSGKCRRYARGRSQAGGRRRHAGEVGSKFEREVVFAGQTGSVEHGMTQALAEFDRDVS